MKWTSEFVTAAALGLAVVATPVLGQDRDDHDQGMRREHRDDEMRQSAEAARREAAAAYAQAKRDCGRERHDERKECLRAAKEDYDHQMAEARHR
jgi:hypothetical protein